MDENPRDGDHPALDLGAGPGWVEIKFPVSFGKGRSFLHGDEDGSRFRLKYFKNENDSSFMARVWFGPATEGPPGHAHGGSMAAVLDESMGIAAWLAGHRSVAARISVDYLKMLPLCTLATVEAWVEKAQGRKVYTKGLIRDLGQTVYTTSEGLFIAVSAEKFGQVSDSGLGHPR
jgi:acyl-coenzyme A thioesterase PaaI-like protein